MIVQVLPEDRQELETMTVSTEIPAPILLREVSTTQKQPQGQSRGLPLKAIAKGLSWGMGLLSFAGASLLLAHRFKLRQELKKSDLQSMVGLNLDKFMGSWYEIAKFPHRGNTRKVGVMVNYTRVDPLTLKENYIYQEGDFTSKIIEKTNTLHLVDPEHPARMQKERSGPLAMNYWVLEVGADYDYAVIGTPDRQHLWILSRTPQLLPDKYEALAHRLKQQGFAVQDLVRVPQQGITVGETPKPVIDVEVSSRPLPPASQSIPHTN